MKRRLPFLALDSRFQTILYLAAIILFGLLLRIWHLPNEVAWYDEVVSLRVLDSTDIVEYWQRQSVSDPYSLVAPIYFTLGYFWGRLTSPSVLAARTLSVILGVLAMAAVYALAERLYGKAAGLVAAFCFGVALPHVYFSQEIRMYSLIALLIAVTNYAFLRAFYENGIRWMIVHIICNALIAWSHAVATPMFVVQGLFLCVFCFRRLRNLVIWMSSHLVLLIGYFLWVRSVKERFGLDVSWLAPPGLREFPNLLFIFSGGRHSNLDPSEYLPLGRSFETVLVLLYGLSIVWVGWRSFADLRNADRPDRRAIARKRLESFLFLSGWLVLPPLFVFAKSHVGRSYWSFRYVLYSALPLYILAGAAFSSMPTKRVRHALVVIFLLVWGYQASVMGEPFRQDYRTAARMIQERYSDDDAVLTLKRFNTESFRFNADIPDDKIQYVEGIQEIREISVEAHTQGRTVWIVFSRWDALADFDEYLEAQRISFSATRLTGIPPLFLYHLPANQTTSSRPVTSVQ
ncbi:MAG TPA: hypothetical protein HPP83_13330 [Candidatus Hydrogenedentes bacterium]|nr:hypothetical protein [Candidatus Hydrogenedentota bacterium]